jgi:hypothetical protein
MPKKGEFDPIMERYWRRQIAAFGASGLSGHEYCRHRGIRYTRLLNWKRRLADRDAALSDSAQPSGRPDFKQVHLDDSSAPEDQRPGAEIAMEVVLGNGIVLRLADQCSMNLLAAVISVVGVK